MNTPVSLQSLHIPVAARPLMENSNNSRKEHSNTIPSFHPLIEFRIFDPPATLYLATIADRWIGPTQRLRISKLVTNRRHLAGARQRLAGDTYPCETYQPLISSVILTNILDNTNGGIVWLPLVLIMYMSFQKQLIQGVCFQYFRGSRYLPRLSFITKVTWYRLSSKANITVLRNIVISKDGPMWYISVYETWTMGTELGLCPNPRRLWQPLCRRF